MINEWPSTPYNCGSGAWTKAYSYNLDGTLHTSSNGVGVTLTYGYNTGQRITSITSSFSDSNHPGTLFSAAHFNAQIQTSEYLATAWAKTDRQLV
jgi:hypothetical protein